MERAKGNIAGAISLLQKYLDTNQMDKDAWEELADMYLQVCDNLCEGLQCPTVLLCTAGCLPCCVVPRVIVNLMRLLVL